MKGCRAWMKKRKDIVLDVELDVGNRCWYGPFAGSLVHARCPSCCCTGYMGGECEK